MLLLQAVMLTKMLAHSSLCAHVCMALCIHHYLSIHLFVHLSIYKKTEAASDLSGATVQSMVLKFFQQNRRGAKTPNLFNKASITLILKTYRIRRLEKTTNQYPREI